MKCEGEDFEYNGTSLNALFSQRRNLFRPRMIKMIRGILRFSREAKKFLETEDQSKILRIF